MSLICENVSFAYEPAEILRSLSFRVEKGRLCAVLGPNGSGKTTLLQLLAGLLQPAAGRIALGAMDLRHLGRRDTAARIGLVPQELTEMFPFSVLDVVVMGRTPVLPLFRRPGPADYRRALDALRRLGAESLSRRNFNRISGGERQIAMLARAMVQSADTLLLDEPTHYLDFKHQHRLMAVLQSACRRKDYRIVATLHDPNMAAGYADQVLMLKDGGILANGPAREVMTAENVARLYGTEVQTLNTPGGRPMFLPAGGVFDGFVP